MVMVCDNMTRKRSRLEMYLDVLEKVNAGISRPTNIMYKCNLSWRPLREILRSLTERGLIEEIEKHNRKYYVVTEKGKESLFYLKKLIQMLHPTGSEVAVISSNNPELLITMQKDPRSSPVFHSRERDKKEDN